MKKEYFCIEKDGFYGVFYPNTVMSRHAVIAMLGDSSDDYLVRSSVKWLQKFGVHVLAMSPKKKDYGHHNLPLERFEKAIAMLHKRGIEHIGIAGASTTGMLALAAASFFSDITLTIAFSPSDFVMEGFYQDGKDGAKERPGDNESSLSYHGKPLPYLPYAYRHPVYWQKIQEESKAGKDVIASRKMFDVSEQLHPLREEEKIKVERIRGHIVFAGAEDDALWDTVKYIKRMDQRLQSMPHTCTYEILLYRYGTHFIFPESLLKNMLPIGSDLLVKGTFASARKHPKECRKTRIDIDQKIQNAIHEWIKKQQRE